MKIIFQQHDRVLIRCDKGDDVIEALAHFAEEQRIEGAGFFGLGACGSVTLSFYDLETKEYVDKEFNEDLEIVSFAGNIGWLATKPIVHAHGVFSDGNYQTVGGHVKKLVVSATCEIIVSPLPYNITRSYDEETGLNLLSS